MKPLQTIKPLTALALAAVAAAPAMAQSDPAGFGTVYNIGAVPPGSMFDVPSAVTGTQVGDGNLIEGEALITPVFLGGDTLGSNSQLNLFDGGEILGRFSAGPIDGTGSNIEMNIFGGSVTTPPPDFFTLFDAYAGSTVNISGGSVAQVFSAWSGSTVNISGGSVGFGADTWFGIPGGFRAFPDSTVNISGGSVGGRFQVFSGSTVNISGGSVGFGPFASSVAGGFEAEPGSTVNISGGSVGDDNFIASSGSTINLFGTSFALGGVELTDLVLGESFTITDRNVTLSGILADGSAFEYDLNSNFILFEDRFDVNATLTVTLVPAPGAAGLLTLAGLGAARRRR